MPENPACVSNAIPSHQTSPNTPRPSSHARARIPRSAGPLCRHHAARLRNNPNAATNSAMMPGILTRFRTVGHASFLNTVHTGHFANAALLARGCCARVTPRSR